MRARKPHPSPVGTQSPAGPSNSLSGVRAERTPPPTPEQVDALADAAETGRCSDLEAERLVGYLMMRGRVGVSPATDRRRRARLRALGVALDGRPELQVMRELLELHDAGDITALECEWRLGRYVLGQLAARSLGLAA